MYPSRGAPPWPLLPIDYGLSPASFLAPAWSHVSNKGSTSGPLLTDNLSWMPVRPGVRATASLGRLGPASRRLIGGRRQRWPAIGERCHKGRGLNSAGPRRPASGARSSLAACGQASERAGGRDHRRASGWGAWRGGARPGGRAAKGPAAPSRPGQAGEVRPPRLQPGRALRASLLGTHGTRTAVALGTNWSRLRLQALLTRLWVWVWSLRVVVPDLRAAQPH